MLSAGLSDIHESVEAGRERDDEEGEVGEGIFCCRFLIYFSFNYQADFF